jgi:hypothetical protein
MTLCPKGARPQRAIHPGGPFFFALRLDRAHLEWSKASCSKGSRVRARSVTLSVFPERTRGIYGLIRGRAIYRIAGALAERSSGGGEGDLRSLRPPSRRLTATTPRSQPRTRLPNRVSLWSHSDTVSQPSGFAVTRLGRNDTLPLTCLRPVLGT